MRPRVEASVLERLPELFVLSPQFRRVAARFEIAIHRVHPESNALHVERGDRASQRLNVVEQSIGLRHARHSVERRGKVVQLRQGRPSTL